MFEEESDMFLNPEQNQNRPQKGWLQSVKSMFDSILHRDPVQLTRAGSFSLKNRIESAGKASLSSDFVRFDHPTENNKVVSGIRNIGFTGRGTGNLSVPGRLTDE